MSSNITDEDNNKNDSFVKLTNEKDCNKLLVSDAIFNNVITFTPQESFKFSENISSEFKKVFKKHRGAICYPELGRTVISDFNTAYYAAEKHMLNKKESEFYLLVMNDLNLRKNYTKTQLELMASYSGNFIDENKQLVCPIHDTNSENLYKISKEYVILYCETKFRLENQTITKVSSNDRFATDEITSLLSEIYRIYFGKDEGFLASVERNPLYCLEYSRAKISLPNKEDTYYKTFAYCRADLGLNEEQALNTLSTLDSINKEYGIMLNKSDLYMTKFIEGLSMYENMKATNYTPYNMVLQKILINIRASIPYFAINTPSEETKKAEKLLTFNMIDMYAKTNLGAFNTYLKHNTESPHVTKSYLMFYSLFYALSYSRNIPNINNPLTSVFYLPWL